MQNNHDFIRSFPSLLSYLKEKNIDCKDAHFKNLDHPFPLLIPKYYADLIDWRNIKDPLRKMVLIDEKEYSVKESELDDPIGDLTHSPTPGIVHRYPDRCLLMLTNVCHVNCRFCFRKNILKKHTAHLENSLSYINEHREIWEVILSGGDPFMLTDYFMESIIRKLRAISHIKMIRFHTRTPAVYPKRITEKLCKCLKLAMPCSVVLHINHPKEITKEFIEAVSWMRSTGVMLLSQTVLLQEVNDDSAILAKLFRNLVEVGVKPYYLHHLDRSKGTDHFRISVAKGKEIMQKLRGHISGLCIPEYVIDTPGGYGKIPVFWFKNNNRNIYEAVSYEGKRILYQDIF